MCTRTRKYSITINSTNESMTRDINAHNETVLNALTTEGFRFISIDSLVGDIAGVITDKLNNVLNN